MTSLHFRCSSFLSAIMFIFLFTVSSAVYMPEVRPYDFSYGEEIPLKINSMTSIRKIPKDSYLPPFCGPEGGGEFPTDNKIQNSPYTIHMLQDVFCAVVCQIGLRRVDSKLLKMHIKYAYHHNWIIDNLPSAKLYSEKGFTKKFYNGGFPVGFYRGVSPDTVNFYVYNHVNIVLDYHKPDSGKGYRVVGFSVWAFSIKHKFHSGYEWDEASTDITKQLSTCTPSVHISRNITIETQIVQEGENILYTYDVIWKTSEIAWSSRWDVYLTEDHQVPAQVHWHSITNSILVVAFLSLLVITILIRNLRRDIAGYSAMEALSEEEKAEEIEDLCKLIHADV